MYDRALGLLAKYSYYTEYAGGGLNPLGQDLFLVASLIDQHRAVYVFPPYQAFPSIYSHQALD